MQSIENSSSKSHKGNCSIHSGPHSKHIRYNCCIQKKPAIFKKSLVHLKHGCWAKEKSDAIYKSAAIEIGLLHIRASCCSLSIPLLSWFKSYLRNRKQFCRVNGVDSETGDIEVGVPQGSCLGPLLSLVYINDLPQAVLDSNVSMYADDTSLCYQSHDLTRLNEAINSDLRKLDTWLQGNKLSLNVAKTHSMLISTKQKHNILKGQNEDLQLKIRDNELEVVKKTKYLGLQIDCSLNWKEQIKAVSAKVSRALEFLRHAKSFLPKETLQTLYTGIFEPHFRYCCSVWGCAGSTEISQLQKLQKRAARIITNSSFDAPSRPLTKGLG